MAAMTLSILHVLVAALLGVRILLRPHRQPESRAAWLVVVIAAPFVGAVLYALLGETGIGRERTRRLREVARALPPPCVGAAEVLPGAGEGPAAQLFAVGRSISGYPAVGGNRAALMADSDAAIGSIVADIDAAAHSVHLLFYIWLDDGNGTRVADALVRAARRGVACRAMVDDIGSRALVRGALWKRMGDAGVALRTALPVGNPLVEMVRGRIDLRDHRKIVVIDHRITYCGSQNCADPAFLPKKRYAPWVDAVMRFEGPIVQENQHLFALNWMGNGGDDITGLLATPPDAPQPGFTAQVIASGPTYRPSAVPELFATLIYAARRELIVTTPYFVPVPELLSALCAAGHRGVATTLIFPARNDDAVVGAICRSHYAALLGAGVRVFEFGPGLLHTKSLTLDGEVTLIGSANLDRRSFDLNYENNILLHDAACTQQMRARQMAYLQQSREVTRAEVRAWPLHRRLLDNAVGMLGPIL